MTSLNSEIHRKRRGSFFFTIQERVLASNLNCIFIRKEIKSNMRHSRVSLHDDAKLAITQRAMASRAHNISYDIGKGICGILNRVSVGFASIVSQSVLGFGSSLHTNTQVTKDLEKVKLTVYLLRKVTTESSTLYEARIESFRFG